MDPKSIDRRGRDVFIIEKTLNGNRYLIRLDTDDEDLAKGIFARFLTDPEAVKSEMSKQSAKVAGVAMPAGEPLSVTEELIGNFKKYHLAPAPLGRGASQAHANDRFAAKERSGMKRIDHEQIAGYIWYPHKRQEEHSQYVSPEVWRAAERLVKRGSAPIKGVIQDHFERVAKRINEKTGREDVETIMFGQLRHCFATWTHSVGRTVKPEVGGVPLHEVADIMGHTNLRTAGKYNQADIKPMVALPINIHHPDEPPALDISKRAAAPSTAVG